MVCASSPEGLGVSVQSSFTYNGPKVEMSYTCSAGEWINKLRYVHTGEYYSAVKNKGRSLHTTTWMNFS